MYPDGSIGPCDCFSINDFYIGNLRDSNVGLENIITEKLREIPVELKQIMEECKECKIKDFCTGGCLSQRYYFRDNKILKNQYCKAKYMLYDYFNKILGVV